MHRNEQISWTYLDNHIQYILLVVLEVMRYLGLVAEVNVHHLCSDLGLWPRILLFFPGFCKAYRGFLSGNLQNQPNILHHIILFCFFFVEEETALYLVTDYWWHRTYNKEWIRSKYGVNLFDDDMVLTNFNLDLPVFCYYTGLLNKEKHLLINDNIFITRLLLWVY